MQIIINVIVSSKNILAFKRLSRYKNIINTVCSKGFYDIRNFDNQPTNKTVFFKSVQKMFLNVFIFSKFL